MSLPGWLQSRGQANGPNGRTAATHPDRNKRELTATFTVSLVLHIIIFILMFIVTRGPMRDLNNRVYEVDLIDLKPPAPVEPVIIKKLPPPPELEEKKVEVEEKIKPAPEPLKFEPPEEIERMEIPKTVKTHVMETPKLAEEKTYQVPVNQADVEEVKVTRRPVKPAAGMPLMDSSARMINPGVGASDAPQVNVPLTAVKTTGKGRGMPSGSALVAMNNTGVALGFTAAKDANPDVGPPISGVPRKGKGNPTMEIEGPISNLPLSPSAGEPGLGGKPGVPVGVIGGAARNKINTAIASSGPDPWRDRLSRKYGMEIINVQELGQRSTEGAKYNSLIPQISELLHNKSRSGVVNAPTERIISCRFTGSEVIIRYRDGITHILIPGKDGLITFYLGRTPGSRQPESKVSEAEIALDALFAVRQK